MGGGSMSGWILSMKVVLISAGVVAVAMGLRFSVPIAVNGIPEVWSVVLSWLKPPYLYIIINCIIITIAASSRFHQTQSEHKRPTSEHLISVKTPPPSSFAPLPPQPVVEESTATAEVVEDSLVELKPAAVNGFKAEEVIVVEAEAEDASVESPAEEITSPDQFRSESVLPVREKPLVSSRFGHRKPNRLISPEAGGARSLRVARPKRQDTLESTWKTITEGRHVPLTRHLKKSDHSAWEAVDRVPLVRKESSLSQDELNRRVEAFIKKFNDEMRMQRQESLNKYMGMINRGL